MIMLNRLCRGLVPVACLMALICGCEQQQHGPDNPFIGNMDDYSYSGQRSPNHVTSRMSANGKQVSIVDFEGRFVWADYAAPWCGPCAPQAKAIKRLENAYGDKVVFLTIMTSESPEYEDIPTVQTARAWAQRFGLNPDRVVFATNLWAWTIPTHILYSPEGQTLYRSTGYLAADEIKSILTRYAQDWEIWSKIGQKASWMRFNE